MNKYALIRQKRDGARAKRTERKNRTTFPPSIFQLNPIIGPIDIEEPIMEPIDEPISLIEVWTEAENPLKKASKWMTHVQAYSNAKKCFFGDAMSRAKPSYQKGSGIVNDAHDWLKKETLISRGANYLLDHDLKGYGRRR